MVENWRYTTATVIGILSTIGLVSLWIVILAPKQWQLWFPGGGRAATLTLLLAIVGSFVSGILGRRAWFVLAAFSVLTFAYMWFFVTSPLWY